MSLKVLELKKKLPKLLQVHLALELLLLQLLLLVLMIALQETFKFV
jgi:hypothetical protein